MSQGLPGVRVVPHQCYDAEQHRRRAKDDPSVQRRLHTEKVSLPLLQASNTSDVISALSPCSVSEKGGMHEFGYFSIGCLHTNSESSPSAASTSIASRTFT